ncbi:MAG: YgjP-like metallopeptidase domain-containing protein [Candidatus Brocadiia bacterium]
MAALPFLILHSSSRGPFDRLHYRGITVCMASPEKLTYTVRESPRKKLVSVTIVPRQGVVVVVPTGFDRSRIPAMVEENRAAIEREFAKMEAKGIPIKPGPDDSPPQRIVLQAIGEEWSVEYRAEDSPRLSISEQPGNHLLISGDIGRSEGCKSLLKSWLSHKTHKHLKPLLVKLAAELGFEINRVAVKAHRSKWASCSTLKNINLSMKLLFLPDDLVQHVLLHELCHMIHMNHSRQFWALVASHDPNCAGNRARIKSANRFVPGWLA